MSVQAPPPQPGAPPPPRPSRGDVVKISPKQIFAGWEGRAIAIDLTKVESVLDAGGGQLHLFTADNWYRIRGRFEDVVRDWIAA